MLEGRALLDAILSAIADRRCYRRKSGYHAASVMLRHR
jgi:hypothetical protein